MDLLSSAELQEWMVKDFNWAAWMYVKGQPSRMYIDVDTDVYIARKAYIKLADKLLANIPGPHLEVMKTWPKFNMMNSPEPPCGHYPNIRMRTHHELLAKQANILGSSTPEKLDNPKETETDVQKKIEGEKVPAALPPAQPATIETANNDAPAAIEPATATGELPKLAAPANPTIAQEDIITEVKVAPALPPAPAQEDAMSVTDSSEDIMAGIKGLRPANADPDSNKGAIESPAGMAKHIAVMGGIPSSIMLR
jgi:hypothetical protein